MPQAPGDWREVATMGMVLDLGEVGPDPVSRRVLLAYDDRFSVEFMHRRLRPYWRRNGGDAGALLRTSAAEADALVARCRAFDSALWDRLEACGGRHYAELCSLAFRQCLAAHKLVADTDGRPLFFSKENFSNGCMGTVDVAYPALPFYAHFNPALLEAVVRPVCEYAAGPRWRFPFAPLDLGRYPKANGQVYGGGETGEENQMPVEECGNMLIMLAVLVRCAGRGELVEAHWELITQWAEYLAAKGYDPEQQLCTDDFAGHLAHNTNLSVKAIVALGAYAQLCEVSERNEEAAHYRGLAAACADRWVREADDGDHARLAFDQPGTWSQKYNLVWDRLLGLNLFPHTVVTRELEFYRTRLDTYGLPLDSRATRTKVDWCAWTATLCERDDNWQALIEPLHRWLHQTPDRVPLPDLIYTDRPEHRHVRARSVVGGLFMKLFAASRNPPRRRS